MRTLVSFRKQRTSVLFVCLFLICGLVAGCGGSARSVLIDAAQGGKLQAVNILIQAGADLNVKDKDNFTPLIWAAHKKHASIVKALIKANADLNQKTDLGDTALIWAVRNDDSEIANLLIKAGADLNIRNEEGHTALIRVVQEGNVEMAKTLIDGGADINAKGKSGATALSRAITGKNQLIMQMLIKAGADLGTRDASGNTPLFLAIHNNNIKAVNAQVEAGADLNAKTENEDTPLLRAVAQRRAEITLALIRAGADVNAKKFDGDTALLVAVSDWLDHNKKESIEIVKALVAAGANLFSKNVFGETALIVALKRNHIEISRIISRKIQADRMKSLFGKIRKEDKDYRVVEEAAIYDIPEKSGRALKRSTLGENIHVVGTIPGGWLQVSESGKEIGWIHKKSVEGLGTLKKGAGEHVSTMAGWRFAGLGYYLGGTAHIMTNLNFVIGAKNIRAIYPSGKSFSGEIVASDQKNNIAIVMLEKFGPEKKGFHIDPDTKARPGMRVHAIGFPVETKVSILSGDIASISGLDMMASSFTVTAPIEGPSGGGPIIDDFGHLIGISRNRRNGPKSKHVYFGSIISAASTALGKAHLMSKIIAKNEPKKKLTWREIFSDFSTHVVKIEVK
ncbi:MAG: hypothetical protein HOJ95_02070 [Nitrospinaceae bacterium]|nr:hypothetical protein [Nitrospinaceae bacterium]MBT3432493.1 hypothetical protein [Nitrospinaceae bacterium]MBT3821782.1 hypothetical protein [Nitrospinaceae bacterium]MBT4095397.1 hypothetical protein [Nitrospinaceae bacterium]MBT5367327.1 hypothetical protein [Nitrospinaceae bacterium]